MALQAKTNEVYKCQAPTIAGASIHVIGGSVTIKGSNVTKKDPDTNLLIIPTFNELVDTGDVLEEGIHLISGLPEWFGFEGSAEEIWVKMGIDPRFIKEGE